MRNHGALFRKAFDVRCFLAQKALRDEEREVGVHVARVLEHAIERVAHVFPDGEAIGFDHHAALDG